MGLPEPPDANGKNDNVNNANEVIVMNQNETDSDDDHNEYDGYTLLPLGPEEAITDDEAFNDTSQQEEPPDFLPAIIPMDQSLVQEVWGQRAESVSVDIEMDIEKVNEVKQAMSNFTLPSTSIPPWANSVPEEMWKENLMDRLRNLNKRT